MRAALGWTGNKIVFVGDSAGGNLCVSVALRLVELGAAKLPNALVPIYTPFLFQVSAEPKKKLVETNLFKYLPSPSRVLSFTDPLLHMGLVIRCAAGEAVERELGGPQTANFSVYWRLPAGDAV